MSKTLSKRDYLITTVTQGESCLSYLREFIPDLILLNITIPGLSGMGLLKYIRGKFNAYELPVIMVTSNDDNKNTCEAFRLGANDYVIKPINMKICHSKNYYTTRVSRLTLTEL